MMKDFYCFGEHAVQVADASSSIATTKTPQNLVTSIYQFSVPAQFYLFSITWSKNIMGQCLCVEISSSFNQNLCRFDIKPWLFSKRKGYRISELNSSVVELFWDLSSAKFGSGPEPLEEYYLALAFDGEMVLLLGDLRREAFKKTNTIPSDLNATLISKREHVFGRRVFSTKAQLCDSGQIHELKIECESINAKNPCLLMMVDDKVVMQMKHLRWKFRGNYTISVDGIAVEVFWDVYNWLFGSAVGHAIFMFQTCLSVEKLWASQAFSDTPVLPWPCLQKDLWELRSQGQGFSLILYAWRNE